jgi:2-keto-4-pentenoate hydratase/2-oxohepta-3-ene-1,7-dioic acid hydratase in catechol pathway
MKLVTFSDDRPRRTGVVTPAGVVDLVEHGLPTDMLALLEAGEPALARAREASSRGTARPLASVRLHAPILRPPSYIILGLNYQDHAKEAAAFSANAPAGLRERMQGAAGPDDLPLFAIKQTSSISGPTDDIVLPVLSDDLDYEAELAFVIGKPCRNVSRDDAPSCIVGYLAANDVSVRDYKMKSPTVTLGKSFDTHGPIGPWIVTPDEVGDPHDLDIRCWVNGELRQESNTGRLIHDCFDIVAALSRVFTLPTGTLIATGTPGGVGMGFSPPKFLKTGDVVRIEIERIGGLENRVVAEPPGPG